MDNKSSFHKSTKKAAGYLDRTNKAKNEESRFCMLEFFFHFLSDHKCVCIVQDILPLISGVFVSPVWPGARPGPRVTREAFLWLAVAGASAEEPGHCSGVSSGPHWLLPPSDISQV